MKTFAKEDLILLFRPISDLINGKVEDADGLLDPEVRIRLMASNRFIHHGQDTRVLQYHIWDRDQPTVFHRHHFKYEVQHDPVGTMAGTPTTNFCICFYMNKTRIYHEREQMVDRVRRELSKTRLAGFKFSETAKALEFHHKFRADNSTHLLEEVRVYLFSLLEKIHPMFSGIMDTYNVHMTKEQRRAVVGGRKKMSLVDRSSPHYGKDLKFRREVPPTLRAQVLKRDKYTCKHCGETKIPSELAADHKLPIARGGLTELDNLQALCDACNAKKGKKLESELNFKRARVD